MKTDIETKLGCLGCLTIILILLVKIAIVVGAICVIIHFLSKIW